MRLVPTGCTWLACALSLSSPAAAEGIRVSGSGELVAKPDRAELRVRVSGSAELAGDALIKYLEHRRRTLSAIEQLKIPGLSAEPGGPAVRSVPLDSEQHGAPLAAALRTPVEFASTVRLALTGIRDLSEDKVMERVSQLVDRLRDQELLLIRSAESSVTAEYDEDRGDSEPIVLFVVDDVRELREQAYRSAFADARSNAEQLARLAGVKLGPVLSIDQFGLSEMEVLIRGFETGEVDGASPLRLSSYKFAAIPLRVTVQVRFGIDK